MGEDGAKRKLTTILASDVEGYSRLMSEDEEVTLATLKDYRAVIFRLIDRHEGRVFNTGGDSVLAEFASAVEAVRCAISIQEELRVRNAELDPGRQLRFRIGINLGDVLVDGDDLFGDGVNVAARLEGVAPAGGICISGSVFDQVKNKLSMGFEDIGAQQVKNIAEPVHAYKLVPTPVAVLDVDPSGTPSGTEPALPKRRAVGLALSAMVLVAALAGGTVIWLLRSTDWTEDGLDTVMTGVTINGVTNRSGNPFEIVLRQSGVADVTVRPAATGSGPGFSEKGKWWIENGNFCMQFAKFAQGRLLCPRLQQDGGTVKAYKRVDGSPIPWTFTK